MGTKYPAAERRESLIVASPLTDAAAAREKPETHVLRVRRRSGPWYYTRSPREMREPFHEHRGRARVGKLAASRKTSAVCSCTTRARRDRSSSEATSLLVLASYSTLEQRGAPESFFKLSQAACNCSPSSPRAKRRTPAAVGLPRCTTAQRNGHERHDDACARRGALGDTDAALDLPQLQLRPHVEYRGGDDGLRGLLHAQDAAAT